MGEIIDEYLPHLEMINDTLDGGYLSKDASVRTLEYATERILEILEEAGQQNNIDEHCQALLTPFGPDCGIGILLKCLKEKTDTVTAFNILKVVNLIACNGKHRRKLSDVRFKDDSTVLLLNEHKIKPHPVLDTLISAMKIDNISNEMLNCIHSVLYILSPLDEEFSERAYVMSMTQITVSLLTRMINHKVDVPNIIAVVSRLALSRKKQTKKEKKKREKKYALTLGQLGCINIFSRVLKKFVNDTDKTSLIILRHCVFALMSVIKNDTTVISKAAGCVSELALLFSNLQKCNTDNSTLIVSLQSAIVSVLKIALTEGPCVQAFKKVEGMEMFYKIAKNIPIISQRFRYIYVSICEILHQCLEPIYLDLDFPTLSSIHNDAFMKDGQYYFPEQSQSSRSDVYESDHSEEIVFDSKEFEENALIQVQSKSSSEYTLKFGALLLEDVSRELHYESILNATVYDLQENLVKTNGNLIFFDCNLRKVNQIREHEYDLILNSNANQKWFLFKVEVLNSRHLYKFNIINSRKSQSFSDIQPLVYSVNNKQWQRIDCYVYTYRNRCFSTMKHGKQNYYYNTTLSIKFVESNSSYYIAYSFPYTHVMLLNDALHFKSSLDSSVSFHLQLLCSALPSQPCHLLTITNTNVYDKQYIFLTGLAIPGDPTSSWIVKGIVQFLLSSDKDAIILRNKFIFKILLIHKNCDRLKSLATWLMEQKRTPYLFCEIQGQFQLLHNTICGNLSAPEDDILLKHLLVSFPNSKYRAVQNKQQKRASSMVFYNEFANSYKIIMQFCSKETGKLPVKAKNLISYGETFCKALHAATCTNTFNE